MFGSLFPNAHRGLSHIQVIRLLGLRVGDSPTDLGWCEALCDCLAAHGAVPAERPVIKDR